MSSCWRETPYVLSKKRVWVAGHNGMVGSALMRRLTSENVDILHVDKDSLDLRNQSAVRQWVFDHKPDCIVIAAAKVGGIKANIEQPAAFFYDNIMIATNIMHAAYEAGVERLVFLGSSCVYPRNAPQPIEEGALLGGGLEPTNEAYAVAKIAGMKMASYYRAQYGCDFISAMPCNLYGPGDTYDFNFSHVIPAMIMKAHDAKVSGQTNLVLWGSGRPLREFLYVDDLADALVYLMKNYSAEEHVNIGSGEEVSVRALADIVCQVVGFEGRITFDGGQPDGMQRKVLDNRVLKSVGWSHKMCLKKGIKRSYRDFLEKKVV